MKRILAMLCALAMLLCAGAVAEQVDGGMMTVINCESWVSLRAAADTNSERLAQVPLGALVTTHGEDARDFTRCSYQGVTGYILTEYLGEPALAAQVGDLTVVAERSYGSDSETLALSCMDAEGGVCWQRTFESPYATELDCTDAFVGGTAEDPLVLAHVSGVGLTALDLRTGAQRWMLPEETVQLGASLSTAVGADGTMYIGGYYGPDPVAISAQGEVLWRSSAVYGEEDGNPQEFWWLYRLEIGEDGLIATYDMDSSERGGQVLFGFDGQMLSYEFLDQ